MRFVDSAGCFYQSKIKGKYQSQGTPECSITGTVLASVTQTRLVELEIACLYFDSVCLPCLSFHAFS